MVVSTSTSPKEIFAARNWLVVLLLIISIGSASVAVTPLIPEDRAFLKLKEAGDKHGSNISRRENRNAKHDQRLAMTDSLDSKMAIGEHSFSRIYLQIISLSVLLIAVILRALTAGALRLVAPDQLEPAIDGDAKARLVRALRFLGWVERIRPMPDGIVELVLLINLVFAIGSSACVGLALDYSNDRSTQWAVMIMALELALVTTVLIVFWRSHHFRRKFDVRRRSIVFAAVAVPAYFAVREIPIFADRLIKAGHLPRPRFRRPPSKMLVSLRPGLYRNLKTGKIHFIQANGTVQTGHKCRETNLRKVTSLTVDDIKNIGQRTGKIYFEAESLRLLGQNKLYDALKLLKLGTDYEIYRKAGDENHK